MISKVFLHSFLKPAREVDVATVNNEVNENDETTIECEEDDEIENSEKINEILSHVCLFNGSLEDEKKTTASIDQQ